MLRFLLIAFLLGLLITGVAGLWYLYPVEPNTLEFEVAKALLQLVVVAAIGGILSLLTFEYQQERRDREKDLEQEQRALEKRRDVARQEREKQRDLGRQALEYREELLRTTLTKTMARYSAVKKARRLLRARAVRRQDNTGKLVLAEPYDLYMEMVIDAQLDIENLARDIENSEPAFSHPGQLVEKLREMDSYLGKLITEYENRRGDIHGEEQSLALTNLPKLQEFIDKSADKEFKTSVVYPYHDVQRLIRTDLLHPNLPQPLSYEAY